MSLITPGQFNWKMWPIAIGFVLVLYATGVPAAAIYQKNPQYKPLFMATMVVDGLVFVAMIVWALKYRRKVMAARRATETDVAGAFGRKP